jgi:hypothetical protein
LWLRHDVETGCELDPYDDVDKLWGAKQKREQEQKQLAEVDKSE